MKKIILILLIIHCSLIVLMAQPQWVRYTPNNSGLPGWTVNEIAIDSSNTKWFATDAGLARFRNNVWTVWDTTNSPITNNFIISVVKDKENKIWIATRSKGILKFDGENWTLYYNTNLGYPLLAITRLRVDENNTLWVCSRTLGLLKYMNGLNKWIRYYKGNSGIPDNSVTDVKFEGNIKWVGTVLGGIARFVDTSWIVYNHNNTPLESDFIEGIGIDNFNNKWFCTRFGGVAKFNSNQNHWTIYTSTNSGLSYNNTYTIFIDEQTSKWIGISGGGFNKFNDTTWVYYLDTNYTTVFDFKKDLYNNLWIGADGVWVYNPNGVINIKEQDYLINKNYMLFQNFPNPFNQSSIINYYCSIKGPIKINIFDITGKKITTLVNEEKQPGNYSVKFNAENLPSGIYFYSLESNDFLITKKMILLR